MGPPPMTNGLPHFVVLSTFTVLSGIRQPLVRRSCTRTGFPLTAFAPEGWRELLASVLASWHIRDRDGVARIRHRCEAMPNSGFGRPFRASTPDCIAGRIDAAHACMSSASGRSIDHLRRVERRLAPSSLPTRVSPLGGLRLWISGNESSCVPRLEIAEEFRH